MSWYDLGTVLFGAGIGGSVSALFITKSKRVWFWLGLGILGLLLQLSS
jgi:hypothetical protein